MYNESVKNLFIDEFVVSEYVKNYSLRLFKKTERLEYLKDKDLAEMSFDEWQEVLDNLADSFRTSGMYVSSFRSYLQWYNVKIKRIPVDDFNKILDKNIDIGENIKRGFVFSIEDLLNAASARPVSDGYIEQIIICMAWIGIPRKDVPRVRNEDVFVKDGVVSIVVGGRLYSSNNSSIVRVFEEYNKIANDTEIVRYQGTKQYVLQKIDIGFYLNRIVYPALKNSKKPLTVLDISQKLYKFTELRDKYPLISFDNIFSYGALSRIYEAEKMGFVIDAERIKYEFNIKSLSQLQEKVKLYSTYKECRIKYDS